MSEVGAGIELKVSGIKVPIESENDNDKQKSPLSDIYEALGVLEVLIAAGIDVSISEVSAPEDSSYDRLMHFAVQ